VKKLLSVLIVLGFLIGTVAVTGCGSDTKSTKSTASTGAASDKKKEDK
jgi:hypothetical protein